MPSSGCAPTRGRNAGQWQITPGLCPGSLGHTSCQHEVLDFAAADACRSRSELTIQLLQLDPVADCSQVVAQVQAACGLHPG